MIFLIKFHSVLERRDGGKNCRWGKRDNLGGVWKFLFHLCNVFELCGTSNKKKTRREAERDNGLPWCTWASWECIGWEQQGLVSLSFVLCLFAEPEAAEWGTSWGTQTREGHWLCCSHLHGPAGPDHTGCGPGSLGQCCWQRSHRDFSIYSRAGWLLLRGFLRSICGVGLCEDIERSLPRGAFSFWVSSTGAVAMLILLARPPLLPPWSGCNFQSFTKWRLVETGCLMPQIESFCVLTVLLLQPAWPQCLNMLLHMTVCMPMVSQSLTQEVIMKVVITNSWTLIDGLY